MVRRVGLLLLLLLVLTGCDWRTAMGLRRPPTPVPPRQAPPSSFPPGDPLGRLVEERGGVVERIQGPMFPEGQSVIFFRHTGAKECATGMVVYNPNGSTMAFAQHTSECIESRIPHAGTQLVNSKVLYWSFAPEDVARVEATLEGQIYKINVTDGVWWLVWSPPSPQTSPPRLQVTGFDANGTKVYEAHRP